MTESVRPAEYVAAVAAAFVAHDFPHGSVEHYARIAVEAVLEAQATVTPSGENVG